MCCILICIDKKPTLEILEKIADRNDDGCGIAWVENGMANFKKGIKGAKASFDFIQNINLPFVMHFRLISSGGGNELLTHPFVISEDSPLLLEGKAEKLLFHNGTISNHDVYLSACGIDAPGSLHSDSRSIAMILGKNGKYDFLKHIYQQRFVIIDATRPKYIIKRGDFTKEDGIFYSNLLWKTAKTYKCNSSSSYTGVGGSSLEEFNAYSEGGEYDGMFYPGNIPVEKGHKKKDSSKAFVVKIEQIERKIQSGQRLSRRDKRRFRKIQKIFWKKLLNNIDTENSGQDNVSGETNTQNLNNETMQPDIKLLPEKVEGSIREKNGYTGE